MNELGPGELVRSPGQVFRSRPVGAALLVALLGAALHGAPHALGPLRFLSAPGASVLPHHEPETPTDKSLEPTLGEAELETETRLVPGMAAPDGSSATSPRAPLFGGTQAPLEPVSTTAPPIPLLDPDGQSLDNFFTALSRTQRKLPGATTRIAHFGDSIIVSDYVSGTLRRRLQGTFGDAGHGYMLIANPWPAYFHNDVFRFATAGFRVSRIVGPLTADGMYGLGGVTFRASAGVVAEFGTTDKGDFGRSLSRFVLSYLQYPGGGKLRLIIDGEPGPDIDTNGPEKLVKRHELRVPDGPHRFRLLVSGGAETRTFGVVLERDQPGVVLDALGVQGARIRFLDKQDDAHLRQELEWRSPDLIVYQFGANESSDGYAYPMDQYLTTMKAVIEQAQAALPRSSCLIIGAMDRARVEEGQTTSMKIVGLIVEQQRQAAQDLGCAYFDTYNSMGGWGSMPAWVKRGLGQADMTHPSGVGAERIAGWIYDALMQNYAAFLKKRSDEGPSGAPDP